MASLAIAAAIVVQFYPAPLFAFSRSYRGVDIRSNRPIEPSIAGVIDDTLRRLSTSSLYHRDDRFHVFLCNSKWRLQFLAFNSSVGGAAPYAMRNIFIRAADIPKDSLSAPNGKLLDQEHRPLSYFIAHEAMHVLSLRHYGTMTMLRTPFWLAEGYADLVAKAGDFDIADNRALMRHGDRLLSAQTARQGVYRRYQLMVETALQRRGATVDTLFANHPAGDDLIREAMIAPSVKHP